MASVIGTGSAALFKAISSPLQGWRRQQDNDPVSSKEATQEKFGAIIEADFIPRFLMRQPLVKPAGVDVPVSREEAERFAELPLSLEAGDLLCEAEAFLRRGTSVESVFLDLLAPSARHMGRMWEEDECDFVEVTMGLWRLQEVMREIAARSPPILKAVAGPRRVLFTPVPGDQHSFGALLMDEVFARGGWESEALVDPRRRELLDRIASRTFDLVGLTVTADCPSGALSQLISAIRSVSPNPHLSVMIGGRVVNEDPGLVAIVGADGTASDAREALCVAEQLVENAASGARHAY